MMGQPNTASVSEITAAIELITALSNPKAITAALESLKKERESADASTAEALAAAQKAAIDLKAVNQTRAETEAAIAQLEQDRAAAAKTIAAAAESVASADLAVKLAASEKLSLSKERAAFEKQAAAAQKALEASQAELAAQAAEAVRRAEEAQVAAEAEKAKAAELAAEYQAKLDKLRSIV